jgi:hypothetical protein
LYDVDDYEKFDRWQVIQARSAARACALACYLISPEGLSLEDISDEDDEDEDDFNIAAACQSDDQSVTDSDQSVADSEEVPLMTDTQVMDPHLADNQFFDLHATDTIAQPCSYLVQYCRPGNDSRNGLIPWKSTTRPLTATEISQRAEAEHLERNSESAESMHPRKRCRTSF